MNLKGKYWEIILGVFLVFLTLALYILHYFIFHDLHHIMIYFLGDLAFLPLEVLLVVLIIHRIIAQREKQIKIDKLGVVINTFFSEVGNMLLKKISAFDSNFVQLEDNFSSIVNFGRKDFFTLIKRVKARDYGFDVQKGSLEDLKSFLLEKRNFILFLLENPMLLENDRFTNLLRAILHLEEELFYRRSLKGLSTNDYEHLSGDLKRASALLIEEYIRYLMHLKDKYPYLFSLAERINPFKRSARAEIA